MNFRGLYLYLRPFDLGVEPVIRGKGDEEKSSGYDASYGSEGERHG